MGSSSLRSTRVVEEREPRACGAPCRNCVGGLPGWRCEGHARGLHQALALVSWHPGSFAVVSSDCVAVWILAWSGGQPGLRTRRIFELKAQPPVLATQYAVHVVSSMSFQRFWRGPEVKNCMIQPGSFYFSGHNPCHCTSCIIPWPLFVWRRPT